MSEPRGVSQILKWCLAGLFSLGVLVIAVGGPLYLAHGLRVFDTPAPVDVETCFGCAPMERLARTVALQDEAIEARLTVVQTYLSQDRLRGDDREELMVQERELRRAQLTIGTAAITLEAEIRACAGDALCRAAPDALLQQTCEGPWPTQSVFAGAMARLDELHGLGSACREIACPDIDCGARRQIGAVLTELTGALDIASRRAGVADNRSIELVEEAQRLMAQVPLLLDPQTERSTWLAQSSAWRSSYDSAGDGAVSWRLREVAVALDHIAMALTETDAGAEGAVDWSAVMQWTGQAAARLAQGRVVADALADPACGGMDEARVEVLQSRIRDAEAVMTVCATRAACEEGEAVSGLLPADVRGPLTIESFRVYADDAFNLLGSLTGQLQLNAQGLATLIPDEGRYRPSEAIEIAVDISETACMAEPGAVLALVRENDSEGEAESIARLAPRPIQNAYMEGPHAAGSYTIVARAPPARGGSEIGSASIVIDEGLPQVCDGFTGIWNSDFGELVLYERGELVRGTYRRFSDVTPGFLIGIVSGRTFRGIWRSELGSGGARLVLAQDGQSFRGTWGHSEGSVGGAGRWNGVCAFDAED